LPTTSPNRPRPLRGTGNGGYAIQRNEGSAKKSAPECQKLLADGPTCAPRKRNAKRRGTEPERTAPFIAKLPVQRLMNCGGLLHIAQRKQKAEIGGRRALRNRRKEKADVSNGDFPMQAETQKRGRRREREKGGVRKSSTGSQEKKLLERRKRPRPPRSLVSRCQEWNLMYESEIRKPIYDGSEGKSKRLSNKRPSS